MYTLFEYAKEVRYVKIVCLDDEPLILNRIVKLCNSLPMKPDVESFGDPLKALEWFDNNTAEIALLDIEMPEIDGLMLAAKIKDRSPGTSIIFTTAYSKYAVDAFDLKASGYILKPVIFERLDAEISYALKNKNYARGRYRVNIITFTDFRLVVYGQTVSFHRTKSKELLAYLVDRQGSSVKRAQMAQILFGDVPYNRSIQKQLDVIIRSLMDTLREYDVSDIVEMKRGTMRLCPEKVECDLYRFFEGDTYSINLYQGEYMNEFSWASFTEAYLYRKKIDKMKSDD